MNSFWQMWKRKPWWTGGFTPLYDGVNPMYLFADFSLPQTPSSSLSPSPPPSFPSSLNNWCVVAYCSFRLTTCLFSYYRTPKILRPFYCIVERPDETERREDKGERAEEEEEAPSRILFAASIPFLY